MRVFVTGGTGFVGAHLVRQLVDRGDEVVCLVRSSSRQDNLNGLPVQKVEGDLRELDGLRSAIKGCRVVFHCAADYRLWARIPAELYANNLGGTRNVLEASYDNRVERVVYTSTVGCLGIHPDGRPAGENIPVSFESLTGAYKRSKFLAEREAEHWAQKGMQVVIVNPSTPVGDLDIKPTPTGKIIVDFLRGRLFAYVETGLNLVDVRDVAAGHILAAEKGKPGEKYILGNRNMTLKEICDNLATITGLPAPRFRIPNTVALFYAYLENFWSLQVRKREPDVPLEAVRLSRHKMWFDTSKACRELGLPQSPVEDALKRAVHWFKEKGYA
jgi:dihydroflavonol-4-reductase